MATTPAGSRHRDRAHLQHLRPECPVRRARDPTFARQALAGLPITVFGDGSQTLLLLRVRLIRGLIALANRLHDPVNIGNPTVHAALARGDRG